MNIKDDTYVKLNSKRIEITETLLHLAMNSQEALLTLSELPEELFPQDRNIQILVDTMRKMCKAEKRCSAVTLCTYSSDIPQDYVTKIATDIKFADTETVVKQLQEINILCETAGDVFVLSQSLRSGNFDMFSDTLDSISNAVGSRLTSSNKLFDLKDLMKRSFKDIFALHKKYETPIPSIAEKLKYIRSGQVLTIGAEPGGGKTTMGTILAERIPKTLFVSYEMDEDELHNNIISRQTGIDSQLIDDPGNMNFEQNQKVSTARRVMAEESEMLLYCGNPTISELTMLIRRLALAKKINGVVIDYAQIIPGLSKRSTRTDAYEELSRTLKTLARNLDIFIIVLSQLNKDSLKEKRAPMLSDLRGSLSFGADSDVVIFLYSVPDETILGEGTNCCSIGKQRRGAVGKIKDFRYIKKIHTML